MFLPSEQAPLPPTSSKPLSSRQALSQTLPPGAWASSEIVAVTLGVILGIIILIALGFLANRVLRSLMKKIEQSVFERVQEDLLPTRERLNAALGIGGSQERGPLGQDSLPRQQFGHRASPPSPPAERQSDIENVPDYGLPSPLDLGQNSQRPDPPYRGPLHHSTAYHGADSLSPGRRDWESDTQTYVDAHSAELPRPRSARSASRPPPSSRGREQSRRQRDTVDPDRISRSHGPRQASLPPRHEFSHQEGVRHVAVHVNSGNSIQSNGPYDYEAGPGYGYS